MRLEFAASKAGRVLERARSERVDSVLDDPEIDQPTARRLGVHSGLFVPLVVRGRAIGVVIAHDRQGPSPAFSDDDLRLAETLAARAAIAVDLSERVSRDAMRRVVEAQELERRRLARELHDETGQALTSILLGLKPLEQSVGTDEAREAVASVRELVVSTLQDVRALAVELRPAALDDFGLVPAVERLTADVPGAVEAPGRPRGTARRRAAPERDRDRPLPRRPGGADEHRQARRCRTREHPARAQGRARSSP